MPGEAYLLMHCFPQHGHPGHRKLNPTIQFLDKALVSYGVVVSKIKIKQKRIKKNKKCVYENEISSQNPSKQSKERLTKEVVSDDIIQQRHLQQVRVSPVTKIWLYFDFDVHPYYSHMSKSSRLQVMHTLTTT